MENGTIVEVNLGERKEDKRMISAIDLYRYLKQTSRQYDIAYRLLCYASIDAYIVNPKTEVYEIIADRCIEAYLKAEECDLVRLADGVCRRYAEDKLTLDEIAGMSKWELLMLED